jgi:hypothetical protein
MIDAEPGTFRELVQRIQTRRVTCLAAIWRGDVDADGAVRWERYRHWRSDA